MDTDRSKQIMILNIQRSKKCIHNLRKVKTLYYTLLP